MSLNDDPRSPDSERPRIDGPDSEPATAGSDSTAADAGLRDAPAEAGRSEAAEQAGGRVARRRIRLFWFTLAIAIGVILLDQLTKFWAEAALTMGSSIPVIGDFIRFQLIYNSGAAFSLGTNSTWIFTILAAAAVIVIVVIAWREESRWWMVALGLLLGGAATHLGDRLFRAPSFGQGHVVDFIGYGNFFIGNVADIMIFFGAVMLVVLSVIGVRLRPSAQPADGADAREPESKGEQPDDEQPQDEQPHDSGPQK